MASKHIEDIQYRVAPILKQYGVVRSSVFGSVARGEERGDSDIDILVEFRKPIGLFRFSALRRELEGTLQKKVDLVTYRSVSPLLKKSIEQEEIEIV